MRRVPFVVVVPLISRRTTVTGNFTGPSGFCDLCDGGREEGTGRVEVMRLPSLLLLTAAVCSAAKKMPAFRPSARGMACHNELTTPSGQDVPTGFEWRATLMANSSCDPHWQAGARREVIDHPQVSSQIEDECSVCHMPITRYEAKLKGVSRTTPRLQAPIRCGSTSTSWIEAELWYQPIGYRWAGI